MDKAKVVALGILAAVVLWIGSGMLFRGEKPAAGSPAASTTGQAETATTVRIVRSIAEPFQSGVILQGRTVASRSVELRAEVSGRIEKILIERGQPVKQGQEILLIAVNDRAARLAQAKASLTQRDMQAEGARQLAKQSFPSQVSRGRSPVSASQSRRFALRT